MIEQLLAQVNAELARLAPIHEGLSDYMRLDLQPKTKKAVHLSLVIYDERIRTLTQAQKVLEWLAGVSSGAGSSDTVEWHIQPIDLPDVSPDIYADLKANHDSIAAAFAEFDAKPPEAVRLTIAWGKPVEQE